MQLNKKREADSASLFLFIRFNQLTRHKLRGIAPAEIKFKYWFEPSFHVKFIIGNNCVVSHLTTPSKYLDQLERKRISHSDFLHMEINFEPAFKLPAVE
jgi:hypothetical protein